MARFLIEKIYNIMVTHRSSGDFLGSHPSSAFTSCLEQITEFF